jgi:hypothetical protein
LGVAVWCMVPIWGMPCMGWEFWARADFAVRVLRVRPRAAA